VGVARAARAARAVEAATAATAAVAARSGADLLPAGLSPAALAELCGSTASAALGVPKLSVVHFLTRGLFAGAEDEAVITPYLLFAAVCDEHDVKSSAEDWLQCTRSSVDGSLSVLWCGSCCRCSSAPPSRRPPSRRHPPRRLSAVRRPRRSVAANPSSRPSHRAGSSTLQPSSSSPAPTGGVV